MIKIPGPIPIFITPFFWVMAVAIGWFSTQSPFETMLWVGVIFVSVLVHEFGHALTGMMFGQRAIVELTGYGGQTIRRQAKSLPPWKEFLIGLNGPMAGFFLCAIAYYLSSSMPVSQENSVGGYMLSIAVYINLYWTVLNLLPIQPLDGGKLVRVVLEGLFGVRGTKIAFFCSFVIATLLGILFFMGHVFLAGAIFLMFAFEGFRDWRDSLAMTDADSKEEYHTLLKSAQSDLDNGNNDQALKKYMDLRSQVTSGVLYDIATQSCASILAARGDEKGAYDLLMPIKKHLNPQGLRLLHHVSYNLGHYEETVALASDAFQAQPDGQTALLNAFAHARLGQAQPAVGWIQCAFNEGVEHPTAVLLMPEFQAIRRDPAYIDLKEKYARDGS